MKISKRITAFFLSAIMLLSTLAFAIPDYVASAETTSKTATQVVDEMTVGWNLGNTLDATSSGGLNAETSWGNPKTTKDMIDRVKAAGFNTVRIPVSWGIHTSGNNYKIDSAWMARVKEIVDYCIDNDMYVILNTHHDTASAGAAGAYYYPSNTYLSSSNAYLESVWTQIANEFKDYDYHLVFETLNEPRLVGTSNEWWGAWAGLNSQVSEAISCINSMNQTCLDAIRSTGGNNATRCIMIPGYAASIDGATASGFEMPEDTATDRLILSVHAYTPYDFALNGSGTSTFSDSLKSQIDSLFTSLNTKYLTKDIPVVIGEMSASNKSNSAERVKWAKYYFGKSKQYGVPCMIWDNNVFNGTNKGECHGHLNRSSLTWYDEAFIDAIMSTMGISSDTSADTSLYPDFASATEIWSGTASSSSWGQAIKLTPAEFKLSSMDDETIICVKFTGKTPELIVQGTENNWAKVSPYGVYDSVAYFRYTDLVSAYGAGDEILNAWSVYVGDTGGSMTISRIAYTKPEVFDGTTPTTVKNVVHEASSTSSIRIAWNKNSTAQGYIVTIYKDGAWKRAGKIKNNSTTKLSVKGLKAGTNYKFYVTAYNIVDGVAYYSDKSQIISTCTNPVKPVAKMALNSQSSVRLSWNAVSGADGYIIKQYKNGSWVRVAKLTNGSTVQHSIGSLAAGTAYNFKVTAYKVVGGKAYYSASSDTVKACTKPATVVAKVSSTTTSSVKLSWAKITGASGYIIEQYKNGAWVRVGKVTSGSTLSYTVSGLSRSTTCKFRVRAYKSFEGTAYYGNYSATVTAKTK